MSFLSKALAGAAASGSQSISDNMAEKAAKERQARLVELEQSRHVRDVKDKSAAAQTANRNRMDAAELAHNNALGDAGILNGYKVDAAKLLAKNNLAASNSASGNKADNEKIKRAREYQSKVLKMKKEKDKALNKTRADAQKNGLTDAQLNANIKRVTNQFASNGQYLNKSYADILSASPQYTSDTTADFNPSLEIPTGGLLNVEPKPLNLTDVPNPLPAPTPQAQEQVQRSYGRGRNHTTPIEAPQNQPMQRHLQGRNNVSG